MPETPEVDTDTVRESIHEQLESEGGSFVKQVALTTALLAAFAAIAALFAGSTVNEALVLKNEATRLQAEASDQWAYYQAKGIKAAIQDSISSSWVASGRAAPASVADAKQKYEREQHSIEEKARELERERDRKSEEADHLLHRHHALAASVALSQVAIALGAVAVLTRVRVVWLASIAAGLVSIGFFIAAFAR
jgi:hypothetical protein